MRHMLTEAPHWIGWRCTFGFQIIDLMLLVIDINKGIQTQTAECIVIGEVTNKKLIVVLNKIDLSVKDIGALSGAFSSTCCVCVACLFMILCLYVYMFYFL
jgi:tRNA U34 5-carboxymethylaminomethyl modifying GTPase MnmE/TrmE